MDEGNTRSDSFYCWRFRFGVGITRLIEALFKNQDRRKTNKLFKNAQIGGAAAMAFMHGAQDGQEVHWRVFDRHGTCKGQNVTGALKFRLD